MKKRSLLVLILVFVLALTACSSNTNQPANNETANNSSNTSESVSTGSEETKTQEPTELIVAADQDPVGLDPHKVPAASSARIYNLVYDGLTKMDADFNLIPNLAKEWEFTNEGKTLTFKLNQGVKFHNGREMTSEDVKFSFERILNPDTGSIAKSYFSSIDKIETPDPYTVVFQLKNADSAILANTSSSYAAIVAKEVEDLNTQAVGTGPFILEKIETGQYVLLKKNPEYFKEGVPKVDTIKFVIMKDEAQRMAAIRAGKVDVASVTADTATLLEKAENVSIQSYQSLEYGYLGINVAKAPFDNPKVREAISYAVDRQEIVDTVWKGQAELTGPIAPAQTAWALNTSEYESYQPNVEKAKQLLAEAGFANGFKTVIQTAATYPDMIETAQVIQQQLKAIGIDAEIQQLEWGAYVELWKSKQMDMMVGRNTSGTDPDRSMRFFFSTTGSANVWNYSNPAYDALVQQALEATDPSKRKELYNQAQKLLITDAPNLFLASPKNFYAISNRVEGFIPTAAGESSALMVTSIK